MNNQKDEALKAGVEENNITESPAEEENLSDTTEETTEEATADTEVETEVEDKRSANTRIRELDAEKNAEREARLLAEEKAKSLEDTIAELRGVTPQNVPQYNVPEMTEVESLVKPGEEYLDPMELERRILAREKSRDQKIMQTIQLNNVIEKNSNRLVDELNDTEKKYPQLVKGTDDFDPEISNAVSASADAFIKANPMGSVKKHIDDIMKPYLRAIDKRVGEQKEAITKQVSETALRPTHITQGEKKFEDMTKEEMEKALGGVHY
jgi:hypothetical protein